jgi:diaminohydroxyphosphoribosylaminopyrimidine deaminase/5-amino-6-(5-phosphoribosylamino)uracil reductase
MLDTDTMLMRRALGLARRGAGLVSPNPMVGAVLVNDGRIVGEGYHRFDLLKHAESYAIETAGQLAGGATLYCNLEPCCHQGRTPPCTDALIEAKIGRAVIAVKDPDRRVNGGGIEQLRDAGIDVEVGLLEDHAIRLNEIYFKFITTGVPFVHGVIEYAGDISGSVSDWHPSNEFMQAASEYDAVVIGNRPHLNKLLVDKALQRERHRQLVLAASASQPQSLESLRKRIVRKASVVSFETEATSTGAAGNVVRLDEGVGQGPRSQLGSLLGTLSRMNVTSLVTLPGILNLKDTSNFGELDKATLVVHGSVSAERLAMPWAFGDFEFDLEEMSMTETIDHSEFTGYPSLLGVA